MSPREFWHCLPIKLAALCTVHSELNTPKKNNKAVRTVDGVPMRGIPNSNKSGEGVGTPNAFVDQVFHR